MAYLFGDCELDPRLHELRRAEHAVAIEPQVFDLLLYLLENRDRLVGRDELNQQIWDGRAVSDWALSNCMKMARQAIGDSGKRQDYIRTFPRRGFRFVGGVKVHRPVVRAAEPPSNETKFDTAAPTPGDKPSIAVLPFENMSGDPGQEYFSDGITEDIITELSRYPDFLVIARNSTFRYRGKSINLRQVADDLGVRFILEGSIRRADDRVRIVAQLIDGDTEGHLWAERYDRKLDDIFAVQDEITAQIASALGETIHSDILQRSRRKNPANLDAYDKCLQAAALVWDPDRELYAVARRLAEEAIALDPDFAQAHAIIAVIRLVSYTSLWSETSDKTLNAAYETARHAVALDDQNYLAHAMLGYCQTWRQQHDLGIASLQRAVALNPNDAKTRAQYANALVFAGQSDEALRQIDIAIRLDPHYPGHYPHFQGRAFFTLRRYEEAEHVFAQAVTRSPGWPMTHVMLAAAKAALGKVDAARTGLAEALKISPDLNLRHIPRAYPYRDESDLGHLVNFLRQAGLPE
jgi:TolB-like protein/Flp pilus assembly protein TadD